jgi:hypothetical protein
VRGTRDLRLCCAALLTIGFSSSREGFLDLQFFSGFSWAPQVLGLLLVCSLKEFLHAKLSVSVPLVVIFFFWWRLHLRWEK